MATGMHFSGFGRGVRQPRRLVYRQSIHVCAQANAAARTTFAVDQTNHTGAPDTGFHRVATNGAQMLGHDRAGAVAVEQNLRMRVQVLPKRGYSGQKGGNSFGNLHCFPIRDWTLHQNERRLRANLLTRPFEVMMPDSSAIDQSNKQADAALQELLAPVIVFGALRSGTTLLRLMLNAHPELNNPGEVDFLTDHIRPAPDAPTGWRYDIPAMRADRMFRAQKIEIPEGLDGLDLLQALLRLLAAKSRGVLCVSMHRDLPLAVQLLPGARVVHLLRDPRDVARSSVDMGWAGTLYHACDHWVKSELDWERSCAMLGAGDWIELSFEGLMDAPTDELARICAFIGVPYSDKMLSYPSHSTYAPPDPSVARQWTHRCAPRDVAELESKIGAMMSARGYTPSTAPLVAPSRFRRAQLTLRHKLGKWSFGIRNYGVVPFFGARLASKLRLKPVQRYFQRRIDARIRQMLR